MRNSSMDHLTELEQGRLLAEYQANVELWQHDDTLRQQRAGNFLGVNTALVASLGVVASLEPPVRYIGGIGLVFAVFGLLLCAVWHVVLVRNAEYVRFRRFQLQHIESKLPGLTTFHNVYRAFYEAQPISFEPPIGEFVLRPAARRSSTLSEGALPFLIGAFWSLVAAAGAAAFFLLSDPNLSMELQAQ
jgi:hypothetical protein